MASLSVKIPATGGCNNNGYRRKPRTQDKMTSSAAIQMHEADEH
jgi:hypothetical protein